MDERDKTLLLEEFRQYLDGLDTVPLDAADSRAVDLFTLFNELAALRTEVKTESRGFRTALDELREVNGWLKHHQDSQDQHLQRFAAELPTLRRAALRPVLLDFLDVHDRLSAAAAALEGYRPVRGWFRVKSRREDRRFIDSIRAGQGMTLRRLDELLARQQVRPMAVLGQPADPYTMTVVELDQASEGATGTVTAELRKGFFWGDDVLRLAEVRAIP